MPEYKFDSKRWCMSMSKVHSANGQFDVASTLRSVAEEIETLRAQLAESERRRVELVEAVRPVVEWWRVFKIEFPGHLDGVVDDKLDALAALVGEEGK